MAASWQAEICSAVALRVPSALPQNGQVRRSKNSRPRQSEGNARLVELVATLEIEMLDQTARVGTRAEMVVQGRVRPPGDRNGLDVAAYTAIDKHRLALYLTSIV